MMKTLILATKLLPNHLAPRSHAMCELEVRANMSLYGLAEAIVKAYGFNFDHAFGFFSRTGDNFLTSERKYELFADMDMADDHPDSMSVDRTKVGGVWKTRGDTMTFLFDYGDMWRFTVQLIGTGLAAPKAYPIVLKKLGKAPEQYPAMYEE